MQKFKIRKTTAKDRKWVWNYIKDHWGSSSIIVHGQKYFAEEIDGYLAIDEDGERIGLVTYDINGGKCQIVTINSDIHDKGIGTTLLNETKKYSIKHFCDKLWLITTNDNSEALRFYQKYGFIICNIRLNEVATSRIIKPEIPKIGLHGIPIRDEIELEYILNK